MIGKWPAFAHVGAVMVAILLVSGCLTGQTDELRQGAGESGPDIVPGAMTAQGDEAVQSEISIVSFMADRDLYHSSELMNLSVIIRTDSEAEGAIVTASGISGRMNLQQQVNLSAGDNEVSFAYTLPRCNVCGGIRAGDYELTCGVSYENTTLQNTTVVRIEQ